MVDYWFVVKESGDVKIFNSYRKANSYCRWRFWKGIKYLAPCRTTVATSIDGNNITLILSCGTETVMPGDKDVIYL